MFSITAWDNSNGYHVDIDPIFAETLRDALTNALNSNTNKGNAIGDTFEIDVEISNDKT
jgi:hypothetical protein